uniref:RING-type E3 ubiquitin transferase n=1 Tax=Timema genevievae TaxID=629358 RepID=A0A7R9JSW7_TIMGE|nr:unnamed protein product [Timema genevievae]
MSSNLSSEYSENTCVVCFKDVTIYSIGDCDHPVCYDCSTRMRVLCRQNECPICRQDLPKVIFTKEVRPFRDLNNYTYLMDKKFKICFESAAIQTAYNKLLEHICLLCSSRPAFRTFQNLKDHMKKEHELQYCNLCVDNLKIFTGERRCYTRAQLALHKRKGDPEDRSHRGHPLCEFCDERYMDTDELYRHLRRDHLFCHFCDADGFHRYYSSYDFLRDHFQSEHYLCEEGDCLEEKFTCVFRSEIDLKAHRASVHGRMIGKAATKQARTLELEFTLAPRRDRMEAGRRGGGRPRGRADDDMPGAMGGEVEEAQPVFHGGSRINTNNIEEFPSLGDAPAPSASTRRTDTRKVAIGNGGVTIRTLRQPPLAITDENFPALGPDGAGSMGCKTLRLSVNSGGGQDRLGKSGASVVKNSGGAKPPTNVSIHVNHHRPAMTRLTSSRNIHIRPSNSTHDDDFPSLSGSKPNSSSAHWVSSQSHHGGAKTRVLPPPQQTKPFKREEDFPSLSSKPAAPPHAKTDQQIKKATSLTIPVTNSWSPAQDSAEGYKQPGVVNGLINGGSSNNVQGNIKVKSKKKKSKAQVSSGSANNSSDNEPSSSSRSPCRDDTSKSKKNSGPREFEELLKQQLLSYDKKDTDKSGKKNKESLTKSLPERKRSELLIGNLSLDDNSDKVNSENNSGDHSSVFREEFPMLGNAGSRPPGFFDFPTLQTRSMPEPPPGFCGAPSKGPPPGFSVTLNSVARLQPNGLTFTSSSGQSYPISPDGSVAARMYHQPHGFEKRNEALVRRIQDALGDGLSVDQFREMSKRFRQGVVSGEKFYNYCLSAMGAEAFSEIFPEILVLLPDIDKQQELWSTHNSGSNLVSHLNKALQECASCKQVISHTDLRHHVGSHALENHFPALNVTEFSPIAWTKTK